MKLLTLTLVVIALGTLTPLNIHAADANKLAMVPKGEHPYFVPCYAGFRDAAEKYGVEAETRIPKSFTVPAQVETIEECIAQGFNGIAISALDDAGLVPVIKKAADAGIKVITFDAPAPSSDALSYIGTNNKRAGYQAAGQLAKVLKGQGKIAVLQGGMDAPNLNERFEGLQLYIEEKAPGMKIVAHEDVGGKIETAAEVTKAILEKHPEVTAIFSVSAEGVPGAARVIKEQKRTGKIVVAGFDDLPETLDAIQEGVVSFCVAQRTYKMGWLCVEELLDAIAGKTLPEQIDTGVLIVTTETVKIYREKYQSILKTR